MTPPPIRHSLLSGSEDLITPHAAIRAGFVALALERNHRATPMVEQAKVLKVAASQVQIPTDLLGIASIQTALLTAAGVSDKARSHYTLEDQRDAIERLLHDFLEPAGAFFVEELIYRFLLTRGDTLGGSMRNIGGFLAQQSFTRALIATLSLSDQPWSWLHSQSGAWIEGVANSAGIESTVRGLAWTNIHGSRSLLYNVMVPLVGNNIDLCLLNSAPQDARRALSRLEVFLALGELKGGIDPAGADEHWKTANSALTRIRQAFSHRNLAPATFFFGAAIAKRMAEEIWDQLQSGSLTIAANSTNPEQLASLCQWMVSL